MNARASGPWEAVEFGREPNGAPTFHIVQKCGEAWAPLLSTWGGPHEANARIAAAAPELFDALRGMIALVELLPTKVRDVLRTNHRVTAALAALAKVDGIQ